MSEPRDIPMVFTTESVRAIFADSKRKTRRLIPGLESRAVFYGYSCCPSHSLATFADSIQCEIKVPWRRGDRLWVKEVATNVALPGYDEVWLHRADGEVPLPPGCRWRSPRFMPKRACRLWLRVESVDVQRVQDITGEDARAEGFTTRAEFCSAWDKMHGKKGHGMESNCWVWVVEFSKLERTDG